MMEALISDRSMVLRAAAIGILPWLSLYCPLGIDFLEGFFEVGKKSIPSIVCNEGDRLDHTANDKQK